MTDSWVGEANDILDFSEKIKASLERMLNFIVDSKGDLWTLKERDGSGLYEFLETLGLQAQKYEEYLRKESRKIALECRCTPTDFKRMEKYQESDEKERWGIKFSSRARKFIKMREKVIEESDKRINLLLLLAPHGFCQAPAPLPESDIVRIMDYITRKENYGEPSGGWMSTAPLPIVRDGRLRIDVMSYLNTKRPRLKIKIHATNARDGLEDKLDIEELFKGDEFLGVVHYHVDKTYTLHKLGYDDEKIKGLEISRSPDNEAVIINLGGGKRRTYEDEIGRNFVAGTFEFWKAHPHVVGGYLAAQLAKVIAEDPRVSVIQIAASSYRK